jgi:NAD(P)-dependent dehydrogenase (short-subunit alcohol dehydrogenase family)
MTTTPPIPSVGDLAGRRALVSGGTRGTGAAVVTRLKAGGAHVTATARHTPEQLDADDFIAVDISTAGSSRP